MDCTRLHELRKQEKCSSIAPPRNKFYKTQWPWQGVKLTQLMSIFTSKKVWKFFIQIQLTKSNPKITRGVKVPCLMPIRVKILPPAMSRIRIKSLLESRTFVSNIPSTFTNSNCFLKALVPSQIQDLYHKASPYLSLSQLQLNNLIRP